MGTNRQIRPCRRTAVKEFPINVTLIIYIDSITCLHHGSARHFLNRCLRGTEIHINIQIYRAILHDRFLGRRLDIRILSQSHIIGCLDVFQIFFIPTGCQKDSRYKCCGQHTSSFFHDHHPFLSQNPYLINIP